MHRVKPYVIHFKMILPPLSSKYAQNVGVLLNLKWTNLKLLLFLLTTTLAGPVVAQKLIAGKVPAEVKESFKKEFPAVTDVKWEMEKKSVYEASFKMDGKSMLAKFSEKG